MRLLFSCYDGIFYIKQRAADVNELKKKTHAKAEKIPMAYCKKVNVKTILLLCINKYAGQTEH